MFDVTNKYEINETVSDLQGDGFYLVDNPRSCSIVLPPSKKKREGMNFKTLSFLFFYIFYISGHEVYAIRSNCVIFDLIK